MKHALITLCLLAAALFLGGCSKTPEFTEENGNLTLTKDGISVVLDSGTGLLKEVSSETDSLRMERVLFDAGLNEAFAFEQLGYIDLSSLATWELPTIWMKRKEVPQYTLKSVETTEQGFDVTICLGSHSFVYTYTLSDNALALSVELFTESEEPVLVNGAAFLIQGIESYPLESSTYEFPGSTPDGQQPFKRYIKYKVTSADYCAPAVQITGGAHTNNILYVNDMEKWSTGCYYDEFERPCTVFFSATEGYLSKDSSMKVGTLYLPLGTPEQDSYTAISEFWASLGYHTPEQSIAGTQQAIYSGHPYGTMDTNYFNRLTLQEYKDSLVSIADMGFTSIWLLPVFQHTGDNVYEPIDQGRIDERYGGLDGAKEFITAAHDLNMRVLFDFVPHGPRSVYPFAKEHDEWISKDRDGNNQIEWECVSMDYNHPDYSAYNRELAAYYARETGLDGARIDCSMGGLSNWNSGAGLRASASGLHAGIQVVSDLYNGFLDAGKQPLILPENFHPVPTYAGVTDIFYDMPLYRVMHNLNRAKLTETEYVQRLTHFLDVEQKTSVAGQCKLRFLGNHDTVTWTFDAERAQTLYGTDRAKALWMAIGWIDGVLYIYQGDENPAAYHLNGENLEEFFTELLAAKKEFLPMDYKTEYLNTESPVFAFYRYGESSEDARLVLVNLSEQPQRYPLTEEAPVLAAIGGYSTETDAVLLEPYSGVILDAAYPQ